MAHRRLSFNSARGKVKSSESSLKSISSLTATSSCDAGEQNPKPTKPLSIHQNQDSPKSWKNQSFNTFLNKVWIENRIHQSSGLREPNLKDCPTQCLRPNPSVEMCCSCYSGADGPGWRQQSSVLEPQSTRLPLWRCWHYATSILRINIPLNQCRKMDGGFSDMYHVPKAIHMSWILCHNSWDKPSHCFYTLQRWRAFFWFNVCWFVSTPATSCFILTTEAHHGPFLTILLGPHFGNPSRLSSYWTAWQVQLSNILGSFSILFLLEWVTHRSPYSQFTWKVPWPFNPFSASDSLPIPDTTHAN